MSANSVRREWLDAMIRIMDPVLTHFAAGDIKEVMPIYGSEPENKDTCTYLEALGRTLCGVAPWLELPGLSGEERELQEKYRVLARKAILRITDPKDPAATDFTVNMQILVDTGFLSEGILRAPTQLWEAFSREEQDQICAALELTRRRAPVYSNWLMFSATTEAFFHRAGRFWDPMRIDCALRAMDSWYFGDGVYGDGPRYAWDYYNSFVMQPMLVDVLKEVSGEDQTWKNWDGMEQTIRVRAGRYADHLERMIMPDGSYPVIGRSSAYRLGCFHVLGQAALEGFLPEDLPAAQVRCGMTALLRRMMQGDLFDEAGWLKIGIVGDQPGIGEPYISTGSLYLFCFFFLPLGIAPEAPFWADPDKMFTQQKIWSGMDVAADHAVH